MSVAPRWHVPRNPGPDVLLALSLAFAAAPDVRAPADVEALLALLERGDLPCSTPVVAALGHAWPDLTPAQRTRVNKIVRPASGSLVGGTITPRAVPPPAKDSCWSLHDNRVVGEHFVVEYEDGVSRSSAETFLEDLEYSWSVEVDSLGWRAPTGSDDYLILAEVTNERTGGAYTWYERCDGQDIPYFSSGKDSWDDPDWGATMAAHEFNHAIQFGYGWANEFWWWEATATWVEDHVYPDTDYWSAYVQGYTDNPHLAMSASDQQDADIFWHMYGMSILAFHLDDHFGGHDTVMATWEGAADERGTYSRGPEDMVDELGLDWGEVYGSFTSANTVMAYDQQRVFPDVSTVDEVGSLPASGESSRSSRPQGFGQNYVRIDGGLGEGDLVLDFEGDDNADWLVQLVEVDRSSVLRVEQTTAADGVGQVRLTGYADDDVVLVVSPLTASDNDFDYAWTLSLEAGTDTGGDTGTDTGGDTGTDTGGDTGTDTADDTGSADSGDGITDGDDAIDLSSEAGGCGCQSTAAGPAAGLAALAALGLALRRRAR